MTDIDNANIGQLADDTLRHLTVLEELVADVENGREIYEEQLQRAKNAVENGQTNSNEILYRFENQVGPIEPTKINHD